MDNLTIKDIEFDDDKIRVIQDDDGTIWVEIKCICDNIGLSSIQARNETKKIQNDLVLSSGVKYYLLGVLFMKLDFVPIWLAKVPATSKTIKNNPGIDKRLLNYQLRLKDTVSLAFADCCENEKREYSYKEQFEELNQKIDKLYLDFGKFVNYMLNKFEGNPLEELENFHCDKSAEVELKPVDPCKAWKHLIYIEIENIIKQDSRFADRMDVLSYLYGYMRRNYGIVWEQEEKEYREKYKCRKLATIDLIYEKETYRSIFESVLKDLSCMANSTGEERNVIDEIIRPLANKYNDTSSNGNETYRKVYKYMTDVYKIKWNINATRFKNRYNTDVEPSRKELLTNNVRLRRIFKKSVKEMLESE